MKAFDTARVRAVIRKELRDYRRKRAIVVAMIILPVIFLIQPVIAIFVVSSSQSTTSLKQYVVMALFLLAVQLFAHAAVSSAVFHQRPILLAMLLFTPLLSGWAIVVGMAVSVRASEVRVAQQLGMLASLPIIGVVALLAVGVIHPTILVAFLFAVGLLSIDLRALRVVARMFDRERLVTGTRAVQR
jgi:hypothetical protein